MNATTLSNAGSTGVPAAFLLAAAHKSSGKTTVSIGLAAALRRRGLTVQAFKKGPDFIDPMWLAAASGRPCRNLDPYLSDADELRETFGSCGADADVRMIEANKGLHDGVSVDGRDSSAGLARILGVPVVMVLDCRGTIRGVAPLLLGYQAFDPAVHIAGVILNRVGGARHEAKLRQVIGHYTKIPVLGVLHENDAIHIDERHLGLVPSNEADAVTERIDRLASFVGQGVDLDRLLAVTAASPPADACQPLAVSDVPMWASPARAPTARTASRAMADAQAPSHADPSGGQLTIAIARGEAFGFYYPEDLEAFAAAGARLLPFDPLSDATLPEVDGLFIGGGFPEMFLSGLQANARLRESLRQRIADGLPTYAECGGLMYLSRSIRWGATQARMVGAIPGDVVMQARPVGRGYVHLEETDDSPWPGRQADPIRAHEFHYSNIENLPPGARFAYRVTRGHGIDGQHDGLVIGNLLATYAHLRSLRGHDWPARFVEFVRRARPIRQAVCSDAALAKGC